MFAAGSTGLDASPSFAPYPQEWDIVRVWICERQEPKIRAAKPVSSTWQLRTLYRVPPPPPPPPRRARQAAADHMMSGGV